MQDIGLNGGGLGAHRLHEFIVAPINIELNVDKRPAGCNVMQHV